MKTRTFTANLLRRLFTLRFAVKAAMLCAALFLTGCFETVTEITMTTATLTANQEMTDTGSVGTTFHFEYGKDTSYGQTSTSGTITINGATFTSSTLTGLTPGTLYHSRVVVQPSNGGPYTSADVSFTTLAPPPPPFAWGDDGHGQLGDGATTASGTAVAVDMSGVLNGKAVTAVAAGDYHTVAATSDGTVYAWGDNQYGELGDGTTTTSGTAVAVDMSGVLNGKSVTAVAAGTNFTVVLTSEGKLYSWGWNYISQLGDGTTTDIHIGKYPAVAVDMSGVLSGKTVTAISAGASHTIVLASDGKVYGWGNNHNSQLGDGTITTGTTAVAVDMSGALSGKTVTAIAAGASHSVALTSEGLAYSWGRNNVGQLGIGGSATAITAMPVDMTGVLSGKTVTSISAGDSYTVALTSDGKVYAWGSNQYGQLGNGTTTNSSTPVAVDMSGVLNGKTVTAISAGDAQVLALTSDGMVYAWGFNAEGQLGNGTTTESHAPVAVDMSGALKGKVVTTLSHGSGAFHTVALVSASVGTAPTVATNAATLVSTTGATLNATVSSNGAATGVKYKYSTDSTLTTGVTTTAMQTLASGTNGAAVSQAITGLAAHTKYYFAATGSNSAGITTGTTLSLTTLNTAPVATTGSTSVFTGGTTTISLPFTSPDADGDTVTITSASGAHLTLTGTSATGVTFVADTNYAGDTTLSYTVDDGSGTGNSSASNTVTVTIVDDIPPVVTLEGSSTVNVKLNGMFTDPGYDTSDNAGASNVQVVGPVDTTQAGTYTLTYTATDGAGLQTVVTRTVNVLAPIIVTNVNDAGPGSLRQALLDQLAGGEIQFASYLAGQTIVLTSGELDVTKDVTITGLGANKLAVSGSNASRVFYIAQGTAVAISGLTIENGSVPGDAGGGIYNYGTLSLSSCRISGNSAGDGGGILNVGENLQISNSTLSGNSATNGGGIFNTAGLQISNSTFSGNSADSIGGAIDNVGGSGIASVQIGNSTLSGNSAGFAGGIFNNPSGGAATVEIGSTILNAGASGANLFNGGGTVTSDGYNLSSDNADDGNGGTLLNQSTDILSTDPMLGPLQDNGGPTFTHALLVGSPALDAGNSAAVPALVATTDQRGQPRVYDDPSINNAGDGADIGAFEHQPSDTPPNTPPTLTLPTSPFYAEATSGSGATVTFNATANDTEDGAITPTATPPSGSLFPLGDTIVVVTATDSALAVVSGSFTVTVRDTTAPTLTTFDTTVTATSTNGAIVNYTLATGSDAVTASNAIAFGYSIPNGTLFPRGSTLVSVSGTDGANNVGHGSFHVIVEDPAIAKTTTFNGKPKGAGDLVPGMQSSFLTFGLPSVNNSGALAFSAATTGNPSIVFANGAVQAMSGDYAVGFYPSIYGAFSDPALNNSGKVAFVATLKGTGTTGSALYTNLSGSITLVAGPGTAAPQIPGALMDQIVNFTLTDTTIFFNGILRQGVGGVTVSGNKWALTNKWGLWSWTPGTGGRLLLRIGDTLDGLTVTNYRALLPTLDAPGQGAGTRGPEVVVQVQFGKRTGLYAFSGSTSSIIAKGGQTSPVITTGSAHATFPTAGFGVPFINSTGGAAFTATLLGTGVTSKNNSALCADVGVTLSKIFRAGDVATGLSPLLISTIDDPVYNAQDDVAAEVFLTGAGVGAANRVALLYKPHDGTVRKLARMGDQPPGVPAGATWSGFPALALPDNMGPVFVGKMALGHGGVDGTNYIGLWALDSLGLVRLIARTGDVVNGQPIRSLFVINNGGGLSPDQTRSFNCNRRIVYLATFSGGIQAIITAVVP